MEHWEGGLDMRRFPAFVVAISIFAAQLYAQAPAQKNGSLRITEPAFQTNGPYKVVEEMDASLPSHTVYRPIHLADVKGRLPVLAWGNGGCLNAGNSMQEYLAEIASYGYLVVANGPIRPDFRPEGGPGRPPQPPNPRKMPAWMHEQTKSSELLQTLDWVGAQNSQPKSLYYGKIDTNAMAVGGQSCGGLEALVAAADRRVKTAVIMNSGIIRNMDSLPKMPGAQNGRGPALPMVLPGNVDTLKKLHTPVIYIIGGKTDIAYNNSEADFRDIHGIPLFDANLNGVGHGGTIRQPYGGKFAQVAVEWLQWQLRGSRKASTNFVGPDCTLCKDPAWTIKRKDMK